jgi:hypothetical protein
MEVDMQSVDRTTRTIRAMLPPGARKRREKRLAAKRLRRLAEIESRQEIADYITLRAIARLEGCK